VIKKIVIAGLFLGGGYFLIKSILPKNTYKAEKLELESEQSADDVFEKEKRESEKKQMELQNKITMTGLHNLMYFGNRPKR
jgi:hypothetical protein